MKKIIAVFAVLSIACGAIVPAFAAMQELTETVDSYGKTYTGTVTAGNYAVHLTRRKAVSVAWHPASGASATVKYTLSPVSAVEAGTANWITQETGKTSAGSTSIYGPITAVRLESTGGSVTFEVVI